MNLDKPLNTTCEVLNDIIINGQVSMLDYAYMPGYRTRISEIRNKHGLDLIRDIKTGTNKFNNTYAYVVYSLNPFHERSALILYDKLNVKRNGKRD